MTDFKEKYGPWAIVAGAAEGLGRSYCSQLAKREINLIMVDYQEKPLKELATELEKEYNIKTKKIFSDLSLKDSWQNIAQDCESLDCRLLVYNAACSVVKPFMDQDHEDIDCQISTNNLALTHTTMWFANKIKHKRSGGILIMSSLAGFYGTQYVPVYSASKAYCYILAEALNGELKPYGIDVMACMAGATATPGFLRSQPRKTKMGPSIMDPEIVAGKALGKLGKKAIYIPGKFNQLSYFSLRKILPRSIATNFVNSTMKKMYG